MNAHSEYLRDLTTGSEWDKPSNGTCEKLTAAAAHIDAQDAKIKALVEALEWYEKRRLDAVSRVHSITAPEDEAVKHLCERHGYGAVIDSAARQWAKKPHGAGAFFVGGCIADETAKDALAAAKETT